MVDREPRIPLMRIMLANALLLSGLYALLGIGIELAREHVPSRTTVRAALAIDSLPARALELVGLMRPVREAFFDQRIDEFGVRLIFGLTAMVIIFALAFLVGAVTGLARTVYDRRRAHRTPTPPTPRH